MLLFQRTYVTYIPAPMSGDLQVPLILAPMGGPNALWLPRVPTHGIHLHKYIHIDKNKTKSFKKMCVAYVYVSVPCVCLVPKKVRREHRIPWNNCKPPCER